MSRTKNVLNNFFYGIIQKFVMMLGPFCVRTTLIYQLSSDIAGINDLFVSILQILNLTELGLSNVIVYSMYKPIAENNTKALCSLLNFYRKAYLYVGGIIFTVGIIILPFVLYLFKDNNTQNINVILVYLIFLINSSVSYLFWSYKTCLLTANQRQDVISRNSTLVNLFLYTFQIFVLFHFKNYYIYLMLLPISTITINICNYLSASRMFPDIASKGKINTFEYNEIKNSLIGIVIWKIGCLSRNSFDNIVIGLFFSFSMVAIYSNYMLLVNAVTGFFGIIITSLIASIGNKVALNTVEDNYKDFCKINLVYMIISSWVTLCLLCIIQPFMELWMGQELLLSQSFVFLLCFLFFAFRTCDINSAYYHATGLWYKGRYRSIIEAFINLILNLTLGYYLGINGIILATIISYICVWFYSSKIVFKYYFLKFSVKSFYIKNLFYLLITLLTCALAYYVCNCIQMSNDKLPLIVEIIYRLIVCILSLLILVFLYNLTGDSKDAIMFIKSIFKGYFSKKTQ